MIEVVPRLLPGLRTTIEVSAISLVLATLIGIWLGVIRAFTKARNPLNWVLDAYVFFVRGTPIIVQIFVLFFLAPELGLRIDPYWVGIFALTFNSAGYQIEIGRAAVGSIGSAQFDAALALGLSPWHTLFLVLVPQALRRILPPLTNELVNVIKASALLSVISVNELTKVANELIYIHFVVIEVLIELTFLYLVVVGSLMWLSRWLERRSAA